MKDDNIDLRMHKLLDFKEISLSDVNGTEIKIWLRGRFFFQWWTTLHCIYQLLLLRVFKHQTEEKVKRR
jgi:hypothetical protein